MQKPTVGEAMDQLKKAGVPEDEMAVLERQLAPDAPKDLATNDTTTRKFVGFVSGGPQLTEISSEKIQNQEEIELPEGSESDEDDDETVQIAQKDVPDAVFGGLVRKRDEEAEKENDNGGDGETRLGALERIKRMRQGN